MKSNFPFITFKAENYTIKAQEIIPPKDCEVPKDFPKCCPQHERLVKEHQDWIENKFPNCCDYHKDISKSILFNKENYKYVPEKVVKQAMFTMAHIGEHIDSQNWYKEITDYIEYNRLSFGHPNIGYYKYVSLLEQAIEHNDDERFNSEKKKALLYYLDTFYNVTDKNCDKTDLNLLYSIFQKWLNTFPNLRYFKRLKARFQRKFPVNIIMYDHNYNKYAGLTKSKARSKKELIEILVKQTRQLLSNLDTGKLVKNGLMNDIDNYEFELRCEQHSFKQKTLIEEYSNDEKEYLDILEQWLINEKLFIEEITPFINKTKRRSNRNTKGNSKKKEMTFFQLFRNNQDRVDNFYKILRTERINALGENNNWIYQGNKSSIVACFEALKDLDIIKPNLSKAQLQRVVASRIRFEGNEKLFRNGFKNEDYEEFYSVFKANLK